jgi:hypothetical protein
MNTTVPKQCAAAAEKRFGIPFAVSLLFFLVQNIYDISFVTCHLSLVI